MAVALAEGRTASTPGGSPATAADAASAAKTPNRNLSDDEILELGVRSRTRASADLDSGSDLDRLAANGEEGDGGQTDKGDFDETNGVESERFRELFDSNPELKQAWDDAQAFRESFATPEEARSATSRLADLNTMDELFFSRNVEDHAKLARLVAQLDPASFDSLAKAMGSIAASGDGKQSRDAEKTKAPGSQNRTERAETGEQEEQQGTSEVRRTFLESANAESVQGVLRAIEGQIDRLLPEGSSKAAKQRVIGEIYRELDHSLQSNGDFGKQVRRAMRSGSQDADHKKALVSLIVGRARQALPSVAKRVMNEWTSTVVGVNRDRRNKQQSAEKRVDIAGSRGGNDGLRSRSPGDIDYRRMSDSDILNL
jgi:hypothetical protein